MGSAVKPSIIPTDPPVNGQHDSSEPEAESTHGNSSFLQELGLVGLQTLELPILCSLVTGDPLLMVGDHGTAKTALAGAVASSLDLRFHAYDASKALFEDIIGFPNPEGLGRGELDYVPTPLSLWDKEFILVDEISRANAQTQSKWLEVIRSRRVMGEDLPDLQYIFSAMNPPGEYEGARPLDPALAGRFAFVLDVPSVNQMERADQLQVLQAVGSDDAPLARDLFQKNCGETNQLDLKKQIEEIRRRVPAVKEEYGSLVDRYLTSLVEALGTTDEDRHLDGRRLGMIRRNMIVALAVRPPDSNEQCSGVLREILFASLPHPALGEQCPEHRYDLSHRDAIREVVSHEVEGTADKIEGQVLLNKALYPSSPEEALPELTALSRLFYAYTDPDHPVSVDPEVLGRIIGTGRRVLDECSRLSNHRDALESMTSAHTPQRSLAVLLWGWWFTEQEQAGDFRLNSNRLDKVPGLVARLEEQIKQAHKEVQS